VVRDAGRRRVQKSVWVIDFQRKGWDVAEEVEKARTIEGGYVRLYGFGGIWGRTGNYYPPGRRTGPEIKTGSTYGEGQRGGGGEIW